MKWKDRIKSTKAKSKSYEALEPGSSSVSWLQREIRSHFIRFCEKDVLFMTQMPYPNGRLYGNTMPNNPGQPHLACAILIDLSGSMHGYEDTIRGALEMLRASLQSELYCVACVEVCIITFSGDDVTVVQPFAPVDELIVPNVTAYGQTPFYRAVEVALDAVEQRRKVYQLLGMSNYRPWILALTDGLPTDIENHVRVTEMLREAQNNKHVEFLAVAIGNDADEDLLKQLNPKGIVLKSSPESILSVFKWLYNSLNGRFLAVQSEDKLSALTADFKPYEPWW